MQVSRDRKKVALAQLEGYALDWMHDHGDLLQACATSATRSK